MDETKYAADSSGICTQKILQDTLQTPAVEQQAWMLYTSMETAD